MSELDDLLDLAKTSPFEKELDNLRKKLEKIKPFDLPSVDDLAYQSDRRAYFLRRSPLADYWSEQSKNIRQMSRLVRE